jgi:ElaB/YqjD/DUF883 family membrane-anchored ribosome-binding protein
VVSEVEDLLGSVGSQGSASVRDVQERVRRALDTAKDRLRSVDEQVRTSARQAAEATDDYVHDRPWQVVAAAAAVGLLVGFLIARR